MLKWPEFKFPPINLWNAPVQNKRDVVYIVYRAVANEGSDIMQVFAHPIDAQHYRQYRESLGEPEDVTYVIQEEEVK